MDSFRSRVSKGVEQPRHAVSYLFQKITSLPRNVFRDASILTSSRVSFGTNIFEKDWDVLIVLDTARCDTLSELEHEYEFLSDTDSIWSVGSTSAEWMANTFSAKYLDEISKTAYITSNPNSQTVLENQLSHRYQGDRSDLSKLRRYGNFDLVTPAKFGRYDPVWKQSKVDEKLKIYENYAVPRNVTDKAVHTMRNNDFKRVVLHYMPPHTPFIIDAIREEREPHEYEQRPWKYIRKTGDRSLPFKSHKEMLRWVLDDIKILLENIPANKVAITADHGDAFGEFGTYGHPAGSLNPNVRRVPWVMTSATDTRSYVPDLEPDREEDEDIQEKLEALGYL
ncbi:hypothetical protein [Halorubrum halophilum]|uniref:hypothetical protein n=1 Tax=Halorubrum halophilum TaxID=413816 RepID=UPI00186B107E|nr:hypothetical protein [Halorubrum halophilum]